MQQMLFEIPEDDQVRLLFKTSCGRVRCFQLPKHLDGRMDFRIYKDSTEFAACYTRVDAGQAYRDACKSLPPK